MKPARPFRIVQWTTGMTASAALRGMAGNPEMFEIVGCYAHSPEKVGKDAGLLAGLDAPIGVLATDDIDALIALAPDCICYMPYRPDIDHVVRILEAGINLVSTLYRLAGIGYGEAAQARIRDACRGGGASLYSSGGYPGHACMMALAATGCSAYVSKVSVTESVQMAGYQNAAMYRSMGYDLLPDDPEATRAITYSCGPFVDQVPVMARALGVTLDSVDLKVETATADEDMDFGFMTVRRGRIAAFRATIAGIVDGVSRIECRSVWKLGDRMTPDWPVEHAYLIDVDGFPGTRMRLELTGDTGAAVVAMSVVNAIPYVVAAPPGVVNDQALPFVKALRIGDA